MVDFILLCALIIYGCNSEKLLISVNRNKRYCKNKSGSFFWGGGARCIVYYAYSIFQSSLFAFVVQVRRILKMRIVKTPILGTHTTWTSSFIHHYLNKNASSRDY